MKGAVAFGLLGAAWLVQGCSRDDLANTSATEPAIAVSHARVRVVDDGATAFGSPMPALNGQTLSQFFVGNAFFNLNWVSAPGSATTSDGLGPLFNARSCSTCHFRDGRGQPPVADEPMRGMVLRLSLPGAGDHGAPIGDPSYGAQLQDKALPGLRAEAIPHLHFDTRRVRFADGTEAVLRVPSWTMSDWAYGAPDSRLLVSARVAPHLVGLGLLEAVASAAVEAREDAADNDHDGISGRANRVWDVSLQDFAIGRFGWKAEQPSVRQQVAGALLNDMGLTSSVYPDLVHTAPEAELNGVPAGGEPEVDAVVLDALTLYAASLAVPTARRTTDPAVIRGEATFARLGCASCHVPRLGSVKLPNDEVDVTVDAYTDLLLHDMGEGLADGRPTYGASEREWRTPPLWGLGLVAKVNGHGTLLHDGRARSFEEAILWHDGEAATAQQAYRNVSADARADVVAFLEAL